MSTWISANQTPGVDWAVDYSVATVGWLSLAVITFHNSPTASGGSIQPPLALAVLCVDLMPGDAVFELLAVGVLELSLQVDLGERAEVGLLVLNSWSQREAPGADAVIELVEGVARGVCREAGGHRDVTGVQGRLTAGTRSTVVGYGRGRSLVLLGRAPSGTTPRRAFSRLSSLVFSRTASRLRIRCCVSGVQKTPSRRRARVIAV